MAHYFWEVLKQSECKTGKNKSGEISAIGPRSDWEQGLKAFDKELSKFLNLSGSGCLIRKSLQFQRPATHLPDAKTFLERPPCALLHIAVSHMINVDLEKDTVHDK